MMSKNINLPLILRIDNNVLDKLKKILKEHNLFFSNMVLVTEKHLYRLYKNQLEKTKWSDVFFIEDSTMESVANLKEKFKSSYKNSCLKDLLVVGFGGGKVIDVVKYFSSKNNLNYLSVPSTLSNDGIYSPVSRISVGNKKKSFGVKTSLGILVDLDIVKKSPEINLLAGVGDLISNISALEDWKLSEIESGEPINDFAFSISYFATQPILNFTYDNLHNTDFLRILSYGLILSGLAMEISGDSRPASGSEHLISHAIDELYPKRSTLHGVQVAFGSLYVEKNFRKKNYKLLHEFFNKIGLLKVINEKINFSKEEMEKILKTAVNIRKRYSILNQFVKPK